MNLTDIYKIFHPTAAEYILVKHSWNILQDRSYFGHKTSLNKFNKIEIISSINSDHNDKK